MTGVLLACDTCDETLVHPNRVPIELRIEDSLRSIAAPVRDVSVVMVGVLVGSLAFHAILLVTAVVTGRSPPPAPQKEITVEIVQEVQKPPPIPPNVQQAKLDMAKPEAIKPVPPPPAAKPLPPKPEVAKPEVAKPEPAKPQAARGAPPAPPVKPPSPPGRETNQPNKPPGDAKEIATLQKELEELRAQQVELEAQADRGGGPLAGSTRAVALPSIADDGELVGYQDLIFSQLAKAKGLGDYQGKGGTTGVRFEVDVTGRLVSVEVAATSGNAALDQQALDIVRRASPFPPPPKDADHSFFANVNFVPPKR